jgi:hypothetical protein
MKPAFKVYGNLDGKMAGVPHISVAAGESGICKACEMAKICYAMRYQSLRPSVRKSYLQNGEDLTAKVYDMSEIPYVNSHMCRFDAFGELYTGKKGEIQLTNYCNTARKNPDTTFVLWTRNYRMIADYFTLRKGGEVREKPANLKVIRSTPRVDDPVLTIPAGWDGVFSVVTHKYAQDNNIVINCGTKDENGDKIGCARCSTGCYKQGVKVICFEIVK